jgi:hypothetical protein
MKKYNVLKSLSPVAFIMAGIMGALLIHVPVAQAQSTQGVNLYVRTAGGEANFTLKGNLDNSSDSYTLTGKVTGACGEVGGTVSVIAQVPGGEERKQTFTCEKGEEGASFAKDIKDLSGTGNGTPAVMVRMCFEPLEGSPVCTGPNGLNGYKSADVSDAFGKAYPLGGAQLVHFNPNITAVEGGLVKSGSQVVLAGALYSNLPSANFCGKGGRDSLRVKITLQPVNKVKEDGFACPGPEGLQFFKYINISIDDAGDATSAEVRACPVTKDEKEIENKKFVGGCTEMKYSL